MMVYSVKGVARLLEVHPSDVRKWIQRGALGCEIVRVNQNGSLEYEISDDDLISFFTAYPEYYQLAEIFVRKCDISKIKEELTWLSHTDSSTP